MDPAQTPQPAQRGAGSPAPRGRIAIAMSGGVDSSVAAALLLEEGWEVVGVHMKLHEAPEGERRNKSCCSVDDALDARQVCARLGIPFYVLDYVDVFRERVIDYFVNAYRAGLTPNPCVMCNQTVKNALLLRQVREFGCDYLATGHYAHIMPGPEGEAPVLVRPADRRKDQTYFLFGTPREELPWLRFPLAHLDKPQVRAVAERHGFITWDKPDSQEVCFVPRDTGAFLQGMMKDAPPLPGPFVNRSGEVLGTHRGLPFYTVGQRRGLGLSAPNPVYVLALRPERNEVVLGEENELLGSSLRATGVNWVSREAPSESIEATVKVRYAHEGTPATITPAEDSQDATAVRVDFHEPVRAIAPGQAAVFYAGDVLLGGGWIQPESSR